MVGLRADTELAGAAEGVPGAVIVPEAGLHTDTARWVGGVHYRSRRTAALVRAGQVLAGDSKAAGAHGSALVDIHTADQGVAGVARLTLAHMASGQVSADGVLSTGSWSSTFIDVDTASSDVLRVIRPTILTDTVGVLFLSFAVGVLAASDALAGF